MARTMVAGGLVSGATTLRVLMTTSVWPTASHPERAPFVVRQVDYLRKHGVEVDVVHVDGQRDPRAYLTRWREVRSRRRAARYDVVHAQWGQAALVAIPSPLPLVITFRGSDLEGIADAGGGYRWSSQVLRTLSVFAAGRADEIIVVSKRLARHLPGRSCHVIPSGLDLDRFRPQDRQEARRRLGLSSTARYVLFAAAPGNPVKRHGLAAAAVAAMAPALGAELLVAAGQTPETMPLYMSASDALILTSLHEGSPNVVKEALACNLPVVSVDVGDVAERLAGLPACAVVPSADPHLLAAALEVAVTHTGSLDTRSAVLPLDEDRLTEQVIDVYRRAIAARAQRS